MNRLATGAWLLVIWLLLWGVLTAANVAAGAVVASVLLAAFPARRGAPGVRMRPVHALRFLVWFSYKLVEANVVLAWEIVTPRNRIREGIVAVPVRGCSPGLVTIIANSISLTPGTVTIEVDPGGDRLFVHVLHLREVEKVRQDLLKFVALAIVAFGTPEAVVALQEEAP